MVGNGRGGRRRGSRGGGENDGDGNCGAWMEVMVIVVVGDAIGGCDGDGS